MRRLVYFIPWDPGLMAAMNTEQPETVPTEFREPAGLADGAAVETYVRVNG